MSSWTDINNNVHYIINCQGQMAVGIEATKVDLEHIDEAITYLMTSGYQGSDVLLIGSEIAVQKLLSNLSPQLDNHPWRRPWEISIDIGHYRGFCKQGTLLGCEVYSADVGTEVTIIFHKSLDCTSDIRLDTDEDHVFIIPKGTIRGGGEYAWTFEDWNFPEIYKYGWRGWYEATIPTEIFIAGDRYRRCPTPNEQVGKQKFEDLNEFLDEFKVINAESQNG